MIRVVLDTNIVVSGLLWTGAPAQAIDAALQERIRLVASEALIAELGQVFSRSKFNRRFEAIGTTPVQFLANYQQLVEISKLLVR